MASTKRIAARPLALDAAQLAEVVKCAHSFRYFITTYVYVLHSTQGMIRFRPYKSQLKAIHDLETHTHNIALKSRQVGFSWIAVAFALWLSLFFEDKSTLMISIKEGAAKRLLTRVKYIYDRLPDWMKLTLTEDTKTVIAFANGSRIESIPTSEEAGRSESCSLLILDEAAFIRWIDDIWAAAEPTLSTGGMCLVISTPKGVGNWFHNMWMEALAQANEFNPIFVPWYTIPPYCDNMRYETLHDEHGRPVKKKVSDWYMKRLRRLGWRRCAQEVDCTFLTSGCNYFDMSAVMPRLKKATKPGMIRYETRWNGELRVYQRPKPGRHYVIGMDASQGVGRDYHALSIRDYHTMVQVACMRTEVPVTMFADRVQELARWYNNAYISAENNGVAIAALLRIRDTGYPETLILHNVDVEDPHNEQRDRLGWNSNRVTRPVYLGRYEEFVRKHITTFKDARLLSELTTLVIKKNDRTEALEGYADDLVFADLSCHVGREKWQIYRPSAFLVY